MDRSSRRGLRLSGLLLVSLLLLPQGAGAGEVQETIDLTGFVPSPVPGEFIAPTIPIRWDSRCMPVPLLVNDTLDPIPNPSGPPILSVARAAATIQAAADLWGRVPTSYARVRVAGVTSNPGAWGFDLVNEVTFRSGPGFPRQQATTFSVDFGPISAVRYTRLLTDFDFTDGMDLNGDGTPDVSAALSTCQVVNGHTVFPAGSYKAGTILDADILFNTGVGVTANALPGFSFTDDPATLGHDPRSVDLFGAAVQMVGNVLGVAHSRTSQLSAEDGRAATMFPFIDTADPADQIAWRSLDTDAVTSVSTLYPKSAAGQGPAALGPGDRPFEEAFGFITGTITLGSRNEPLLGASVFAVDADTGAVAGTAISGHSRFSSSPNGIRSTFLDASFHAIDGKYTLALPPGRYRIGVDPLRDDRTPMPYNQCNFETQFTHILAQNDFEEKLYTGDAKHREEGDEPGVVRVRAGQTVTGIDIVTDRTVKIDNFGLFDHRGFAGAQPGTYYAVRVPREQLQSGLAAAGSGAVIQAAAFLTVPARGSSVPRFAAAAIVPGRLGADGSARLDLGHPLLRRHQFVGRDTDFARLEAEEARRLTDLVLAGMATGAVEDLFLVLQLPSGTSADPHSGTPQIGLDGGTPDFGLSYSSLDGESWRPVAGNFMFKLILGPDPR